MVSSVGCATSRAGFDVPLDDPGPLAENWELPHRIIEGFTGTQLTEKELFDNLSKARVVYVAERHDRAPDHAVQLRVLAELHQRDPSIALGIEMLPRDKQPMLDAYIEGALSEAGLLVHVDWKNTWGFDFALYRPLFAYARTHRIPMVALNMRSEVTRAVARDGVDGLDPELAAELPELDLEDEDHRQYVLRAFEQHMGEGHGDFDYERFYQAQVVWDETMADTISRVMTSTDAPQRMVVLAGAGHVEYRFGIPERAARRTGLPYRTVLPTFYNEVVDELADMIQNSIADFVWLMAEDDREFPIPSAEFADR